MESNDIENLVNTIRFTRKCGYPDDYAYFARDDFPLLHEDFEIFFMITGDIAWFVENKMYDYDPGSLIIFNNYEVHKLTVRSNKRFERLRLLFDPRLARLFSFRDKDLLSCFTDRPIGFGNILKPAGVALAEVLRGFESLERSIGEASTLNTLTNFLNLLSVVNRLYGEREDASKDSEMPEPVNRVLDYIETHLNGDLSLETIGRGCGSSIYHMSRVFKKRTGSTIHNYVLFKRVSAAKQYLAEGWSSDKVRDLCGFGTGLAFTSAFRKIAGVTPAAFARAKASAAKEAETTEGSAKPEPA